MEPIFNKTEKIEYAIKFWSQEAIVSLLFTILFSVSLKFSITENLSDYIIVGFLIYFLYNSIKALFERHKWVQALKDGLTDEFFDFD
jgi:hypothetical protein